MNRRGLIVTSVAGMLGITGCSAILESPEARILGIEFLNLHNTAHELKMELTESDEVVLNDQTELPSAEYNRGDLKRATTHVVRDVPDDPKEYVIHAWLDGDGPRVFRTGDSAKSDCLYLRLFVTREAELVIATTSGCPEEPKTET